MCWDYSKGKDKKNTWKSIGVFLIVSLDTPESNLPIMILLLNDKKVLLQGFKTAQRAKLTDDYWAKLCEFQVTDSPET